MPRKRGNATGTYPAPGGGGGGTPPTANLDVGPSTSGYVTHGVFASALRSVAGTNPIASYSFNWGDGNTSNSTFTTNGVARPVFVATHRYTVAAVYTLTLTVTDTAGQTGVATTTITVNALPATTVTVNPGDDVIAKLNAAAASAVIRINAGTYTATGAWTPKANQIVWASGAVTITGNNTVQQFCTPSAGTNSWQVRGVRITAFITAGGFTTFAWQVPVSGVVIADCEIDHCGKTGTGGGGINLFNSSNLTIDTCNFHDNVVYAAAGAGGNPSNTVIMNSTLNNNYTDTALSNTAGHYPWLNDGVFKVVQNLQSWFLNNTCTNNNGMAAWWDTNNHKVFFALNTCSGNRFGGGPFLEDCGGTSADNLYGTGYSLLVYFNTVGPNGNTDRTSYNANPHPSGQVMPGGVVLLTSPYVDIQYNIIDGGLDSGGKGMCHGVVLDYGGRSPAAAQPLSHVNVQHNDIRVGSGSDQNAEVKRAVGLTNQGGLAGPLPTVITVDNNDYYLDNVATDKHFAVPATTTTFTICTYATWQAAGFDAASSTHAYASWPH